MKNKLLSTNLSKPSDKNLSKWDEAISEAKRRISELKSSIRAFEHFKSSGVPFPSEKSEKTDAGA